MILRAECHLTVTTSVDHRSKISALESGREWDEVGGKREMGEWDEVGGKREVDGVGRKRKGFGKWKAVGRRRREARGGREWGEVGGKCKVGEWGGVGGKREVGGVG